MCCNFACSCICAYLLPPLGVYWRFGCGLQFLICCILTLMGYLPGVVYAVCIIGCENQADARERVGDVVVAPSDYLPLGSESQHSC
mmetsp:Transcript_25632/g.40075  ORF Transcript_25632/g.40075 Transcript_25632/m.40075 type:complete len:86 (-) Transcript_25632:21-278(-)